MAFEEYVYSGTQRLRRGYTTGTCATLAAKAAATMLLSGEAPCEIEIMTPAQVSVCVEPMLVESDKRHATFAVIKDAGDDYDVTDGIEVRCTVSLIDFGVEIDGGDGVGRVTAKGLDQPVGNAAINSGPRAMIAQVLQEVSAEYGYQAGLKAVVEVAGGEEIAKKTFNSSIGIMGGISILGTSGIVEPQSLQALKDALEVEVKFQAAQGAKHLIVTPGNYGEAFLPSLGLPSDLPTVKCANFIGDTLDFAVREGFEQILLVGHIGKLVKVAGNIMDTHSRMADCRREIFAAHAAYCGASQHAIAEIFDAMTTDACLEILDVEGLRQPVLERIAGAIQEAIQKRVGEDAQAGAVIYSNQTGLLAMTDAATQIIDTWKVSEQ